MFLAQLKELTSSQNLTLVQIIARSALSSLCAQIRSCPFVRSFVRSFVRFLSDFYQYVRQKHCADMRLPTETLKSGSWKVSKSYPPLISLASGI